MLYRPARFGGRRGKFGAGSGVITPAPEVSIFSPYTWSRAFDSKDALASSWASTDLATVLTAANAATLNQSTSGLTEANGIGASRSGKALRPGTTGYVGTANKPAGSLHFRALVRPDASPAATGYIYQHRTDSTHLSQLFLTSSGLLFVGFANGTLQSTPTTAITLGVWNLIDLSYQPGVSIDVWVNGVNIFHRTDYVQDPTLTSAPLGIGGQYNGSSPFLGSILFVGRRYGLTMDLTTHQADAHAIGLY